MQSKVLPSDFTEILHLNVEGFFKTPMYDFFFPDSRTQKDRLRWLLEKTLQLKLMNCVTDRTPGALTGVAWWYEPRKTPHPTLFQYLRSGLWKVPFRLGPSAVKRLDHGDRIINEMLDAALQIEPHFVLDSIVVHPQYQGRGIGSELVQRGLERADKLHMPAYVVTNNPKNLPFYGKHGFILEKKIHSLYSGLTTHGLRRPAR